MAGIPTTLKSGASLAQAYRQPDAFSTGTKLPLDHSPNVACWGLDLFENSSDLDIVAKFDHAAGINELERTTNLARGDSKSPVRYSIFGGQCSDGDAIAAVRLHLVRTGQMKKLAAKQIANFFNPLDADADYTCKGRTCVILGACLLSLGCNLQEIDGYMMYYNTFEKFLKAVLRGAPITDEARATLEKALSKRPGNPFTFPALTLEHYRAKQTEKGLSGDEIESPRQDFIEGKPAGYKSKKTAGSNFSMVVCPCVKGDLYHGGDEIGCGSCHKTKGTTLICSRCKEQVYCSEKCQKKDYRRHKACCRTPESRAKMFGANFAMWQNTHIPPAGANGCAPQ